jgi:arylsulfatase A-like enzyme
VPARQKSHAVFIAALVALLSRCEFAAAQKPNVLVILADDMGYGDVGFNGCRDIPTPHIDSIAKNGIRFTQGYVTAPQCGPSRGGLLSGIYQNRLGIESNDDIGSSGVKLGIQLYGDYLHAVGYRTGIVGKWHLGHRKGSLPLERGFDWFYGFHGGDSLFFPQPGQDSIPLILENELPQTVTGYLTDVLTDAAIRFIQGDTPNPKLPTPNSQPFFLYLSYNAPHAPLQAPEEYLKKFGHLAVEGEPGLLCKYTKKHIDHPRQVYAAMVSNLDDNIGRVLDALRQNGLEENTLIFFLSDNGGPTDVTSADNGPLRGKKGDLLEGGCRVPFAIQWKGTVASGQTMDTPVFSLDLLPTSLAAAGAAIPDVLDGINLLPLLRDGKPLAPRTLFWRFPGPPHYPVWGIRHGGRKLVAEALRGPNGRGFNKNQPGKVGLYNLADDIAEERDLTAQFPEIRQQLQNEWEAWNATLPELKRP